MDQDRRKAARSKVEVPVEVRIGLTNGTLLDLSTIGARVEHDDKLTVGATVDLELRWSGHRARMTGKVVRSEISGRKGGGLVYHSGVQFREIADDAAGLIAAILRGNQEPPEPPAPAPPPPSAPDVEPLPPLRSGSMFLPVDDEETMPYIMLRYRDSRWSKHYTATPQQPEDGLTVRRDQANEIDMLQRTYETADPETRRMMRIAMAAQLGG